MVFFTFLRGLNAINQNRGPPANTGEEIAVPTRDELGAEAQDEPDFLLYLFLSILFTSIGFSSMVIRTVFANSTLGSSGAKVAWEDWVQGKRLADLVAVGVFAAIVAGLMCYFLHKQKIERRQLLCPS